MLNWILGIICVGAAVGKGFLLAKNLASSIDAKLENISESNLKFDLKLKEISNSINTSKSKLDEIAINQKVMEEDIFFTRLFNMLNNSGYDTRVPAYNIANQTCYSEKERLSMFDRYIDSCKKGDVCLGPDNNILLVTTTPSPDDTPSVDYNYIEYSPLNEGLKKYSIFLHKGKYIFVEDKLYIYTFFNRDDYKFGRMPLSKFICKHVEGDQRFDYMFVSKSGLDDFGRYEIDHDVDLIRELLLNN